MAVATQRIGPHYTSSRTKGGEVMLPNTNERVLRHSPAEINQCIRRQTEARVARVAAGGKATIERRLAELDREWDIERYLETMAPTFSLIGLGLGVTVHKAWLIIPAVVQAF